MIQQGFHTRILLQAMLLMAAILPTRAAVADLLINEIQVSNLDMVVDKSFNFGGWVEFFNPTDEVISLTGCGVSNTLDTPYLYAITGTMNVPAHGFATLFFDHNNIIPSQASFTLDADGGMLYVTADDGTLVLAQEYPEAITRTSYARTTDGGEEWDYTDQPTPGCSNATSTFCSKRLTPPSVNVQSCVFTKAFNFTVNIPGGCALYYTTDGSLPTEKNGKRATSSRFSVGTKTAIYRFRLYRAGYLPSPVVTRSFIYSTKTYTVPVVSLVTNPDFIYGDSLGIMVRGKNGIIGLGQDSPANWNRDWERAATLQYILPDGSVGVDQEGNVAVFGGWSRANSPHSFKFKANKLYEGVNWVDYPFFASKPHLRHKVLQFRSGGNDNSGRLIDAALQTVIQSSGLNVDGLAYQPTVHFINGEYKGVINLREPTNKQFARANYNWDDTELDCFEYGHGEWVGNTILPVGYNQMCGTKDALNELRTYTKKCNNEDAYDEVCRRLDIDEFINYMATGMYLGSGDWLNNTNNVKGWWPRTDDGRLRIVQFDLDAAFATTETFGYVSAYKTITNNNTGAREDFDVVNMFRDLCNNPRFRRQFIDSYCIIIGSVFNPDRVAHIVDSLVTNVEPMMKLEGRSAVGSGNTVKNGCSTSRASTMISKMQGFASLKARDLTKQQVSLSTNHHGTALFINGLPVPTNKFNGTLLGPVTVRAEVPAGYHFVGWRTSGGIVSTQNEYTLPEGTTQYLVAVSERDADDAFVPVRINEVSAAGNIYVNEYWKRCDWLELYNASDKDVDVSGMTLSAFSPQSEKAKNCTLSAPAGVNSVIPPHGHLVLWCDEYEPLSEMHVPFKLDVDSGMVVLTAADSAWADTLCYIPHDKRASVGLYPDGGSQCYTFALPSIDAPNRVTSYSQPYDSDALLTDLLTGIELLEENLYVEQMRVGIYDMMGRRIAEGTDEETLRSLPKGIYIMNGKKVSKN